MSEISEKKQKSILVHIFAFESGNSTIDMLRKKENMDERIRKVNKLIDKIANGDINALGSLFEEVGGLLLRMAKKYLLDKSLAEDLVSEVFSRLVRRAHSFDVKKNGLNWLYKSIHNEAINWNKDANSNYYHDSIDDHYDLADVLISLDDNPDIIMLREAFNTLSKTENEILYYKFWEGLTVREIAKLTTIPRSTVQDIVEKSLEKIRKIME